MLRSAHLAVVVAVAATVFASCGGERVQTPPAEDVAQSGPMPVTPTITAAATADIVETAKSAGQFQTLLTALKQADLVTTLRGRGPFTVFAPTDAAFAKLPAGTLDSLLKPENKTKLHAILAYHVVPSRVMSSEAMQLPTAETVNGKKLTLSHGADGGLRINNASVVKPDIVASNGVIHVIDTVLMPPE